MSNVVGIQIKAQNTVQIPAQLNHLGAQNWRCSSPHEDHVHGIWF